MSYACLHCCRPHHFVIACNVQTAWSHHPHAFAQRFKNVFNHVQRLHCCPLWLSWLGPWCVVVGRIALAGTTILGSPVDCLDESLVCFGRDEIVLAFLCGPDLALANRDFPRGTVSASPTAIMASKFMNFPGPKKGKGRMVVKRPAAKKTKAWKKTPYVRGHRVMFQLVAFGGTIPIGSTRCLHS